MGPQPLEGKLRDNGLAAASVVGGFALAFLSTLGPWAGPGDLLSGQMAEGMAATVLHMAGFFIVGAFLGAGVPWAVTRLDKDVLPGVVALGAFLGAWLGLASGIWPLSFGTAWIGARLACLLKRPKPGSTRARLILVLVLAGSGAGMVMWILRPSA